MKKIILLTMFSMLMLAGNVKAQQTKEDSIRIEQDILQAKLDSLLYDEAVKAIDDKAFPDFITFLRHHIAHIENQLITPNNWVVLGGASEKHVPL